MRKIKVNDKVLVLAGRDKGANGIVKKILDNGERAIVEGVAIVKKHQKPDPRSQKPGEIIEKEAPIHISNLAIFNPQSGKKDKVIFLFQDGKKYRCFKSNKERIDKA